MLEAFLRQQKFTDEEAAQIEANVQEIQQENYQKAKEQMNQDQSLIKTLNIPCNIPETKTESHLNFKNYDHSLEKARNDEAGIKQLDQTWEEEGIEFGNLTSKDIL